MLEFDGAATHFTRRAFREDRARDRALTVIIAARLHR
jgi:hypothetical protein